MDKNRQFSPKDFSIKSVIAIVCVASLVILSLFTGYFLSLAWLLSLLAPLTYAQAVTVSVLVTVSGFLILARLPTFDVSLILICAFVFAVVSLVEVLLARLVALITPLSVWEASLLVVSTAALLLFIIVQMILDSGTDLTEPDDEEDWDASTVARRLSPDMYVLKPRETETPAPRRPRSQHRRSKRKTDDTEID